MKIGLFVPEQPSRMKRFLDWMKGTNPEFVDPRVLNENEGRQGKTVTPVFKLLITVLIYQSVFKNCFEQSVSTLELSL